MPTVWASSNRKTGYILRTSILDLPRKSALYVHQQSELVVHGMYELDIYQTFKSYVDGTSK